MQNSLKVPDLIILDVSDELDVIDGMWPKGKDPRLVLRDKEELFTQVLEALSDKNDIKYIVPHLFSLWYTHLGPAGTLTPIYDKVKAKLGVKLEKLNFSELIKQDGGYFNYFFKSLSNNRLIIKRLT